MKKYILIALLTCIYLTGFSQIEKARTLVDEGVVLHDKGEYENAIKKYDEAILADASYITAFYEKSYTLYTMKRYEECISISRQMIREFPDSPLLKRIYVNLGSSYDDMGRSTDALKAYDEGLRKFPDYFLLHFNKAITYQVMNDVDKAYAAYQDALIANPLHASSYFRIADILRSTNHIPAMLACIMHLIIEPQGDRAALSFNSLKELIYANVKKTGDKNVTITMDANMFDKKKDKNKIDNFGTQELVFRLSSALDKDSVMSSITKTDIEKFDLKLQLLINSLAGDGKGFFIERYVPFFKKLKENDYTRVVSRLVFANTKDEANAAWLKVNTDSIDEFYKWVEEYKWPEK